MRVLVDNNTILFCGSDVAKSLGYKRPADAITAHCKGSVIYRLLTNGGEQNTKFIPEGDVYRLITHSKLPDGYVLQGFRRKRLQTLRFSLLTQPEYNFTMIILEVIIMFNIFTRKKATKDELLNALNNFENASLWVVYS